MNNEWLLTEDEIVEEASKDSTYCQLSVDIGVWAAKAQAKKLVEWIERNKGLGYCSEPCFHITDRFWQALKKEVGIK